MNRSKDRHMVSYCSSCREDGGRHTLRGSHSSSHDSRRGYLLDAYLENSPIFEEISIIAGGVMVTGGAAPRITQARGAAPRGEWPFAIDFKGGELITLM
jgi:hypothetical protein